PDTGVPKNVIKLKEDWTDNCHGLLRLPAGDFLAYYNLSGPYKRNGLHLITKDGTVTKIPGIPSKEQATKSVDDTALSPDGRYVLFQGSERQEVWDWQNKKLVLDWRQEYRTPRAGRFTGDGRLVVVSVKTSLKEIATSNLSGGWVNNSARLDVLEFPSLRVA